MKTLRALLTLYSPTARALPMPWATAPTATAQPGHPPPKCAPQACMTHCFNLIFAPVSNRPQEDNQAVNGHRPWIDTETRPNSKEVRGATIMYDPRRATARPRERKTVIAYSRAKDTWNFHGVLDIRAVSEQVSAGVSPQSRDVRGPRCRRHRRHAHVCACPRPPIAGGRDAPTSDGDETIASMRNRSSDQGAAWMLTSLVSSHPLELARAQSRTQTAVAPTLDSVPSDPRMRGTP